MLKVAHVTTLYYGSRDGLEPKLTSLDFYKDIEITAIGSSKNQNKEYPPSCVRQLYCPFARSIRPLADIRSIVVLYRLFRRERFDIVHTHTSKAGMIGAIAAKLAALPLVFHTSHGLPFYDGQNKWGYHKYRFLEILACKFRDHYFSQNERDLPECIKLMGSESNVSYEGNGVDVEFIKQSAKKQLSQALKEYPNKGIRLVLLSRLESVKRVDDFFKVVDKLKKKGVEVSCVVAGAGVLERQLRAQLIEMQLDDCVNMVGFTERPHGIIAASDIVLLCSEKEGIPRTIMEAMALQKPVVATDVLGTQELVVDAETGFLVPFRDIDAMAEKVELLVRKGALREKMGRCGLKRITAGFNKSKIAEFLHEFYVSQVHKTRGKNKYSQHHK